MANPNKFNAVTADKDGNALLSTSQTLVADTAAITSSALATTAATQTSPYGFAGAAQADAIATEVNKIRTDVAAIRTTLLAALDVLEAHGLMKDA
mgnify:CR=1 FL=1